MRPGNPVRSAAGRDPDLPRRPRITEGKALAGGEEAPISKGMKTPPISLFTICGLEELGHHSERGVTHVLSLLDPDWPEPQDFHSYDDHHRTTLHFHDVIGRGPNLVVPQRDHVEKILAFGRTMGADMGGRDADAHLLVHCHMGISRSTAAVAMLLAQAHADEDEAAIYARLGAARPQAWPNSLMIGFADELMRRDGRLIDALADFYARQLHKKPEIEDFMRKHGRGREIDMALQAAR